jgi:hypothetical protein
MCKIPKDCEKEFARLLTKILKTENITKIRPGKTEIQANCKAISVVLLSFRLKQNKNFETNGRETKYLKRNESENRRIRYKAKLKLF